MLVRGRAAVHVAEHVEPVELTLVELDVGLRGRHGEPVAVDVVGDPHLRGNQVERRDRPADVGAIRAGLEVGQQSLDRVDVDRVVLPLAALAGSRQGVDADDLVLVAEQRATAVARVERGGVLDQGRVGREVLADLVTDQIGVRAVPSVELTVCCLYFWKLPG